MEGKKRGKGFDGTPVSVGYRFDDALSQLKWQQFEHVMARWYQYEGFTVTHRGTGKGKRITDGGVDLVLERGNQRIIVDCKHWKTRQVPFNPIVQIEGLLVHEKADSGIVVITSEFTDKATKLGKSGNVRLIDGRQLRDMIEPHLSWLLDDGQPIPLKPRPVAIAAPISMPQRAETTIPMPLPSRAIDTVRPVLPTAKVSVVSRPWAPRRHALRWAAAACALPCLAVLWATHGTSSTDVADTGPPAPVVASSPTPPPKPVRKQEPPARPVVSTAKHASGRTPAKTAPPADVRETPAQEPAVIYKSGDMSDAEFAAWKARKADRENGRTGDIANGTAPRAPEDTAYGPTSTSNDVATSPETMRTILRTNRR
ncbi:MAG: hypothetical protein GAK28_03574 [Luteibacter sp.]|uniref:restriction endonuclease n=1 Tax=Luteibacter sp. TaxID=1886636 RepID=UPI00137D5F33|nr:restriction endonuclease [Luteibacter sp.]KAF1004947.1 MAG: hypothetical protein GAK28_03574 [Luteibacter sp.]